MVTGLFRGWGHLTGLQPIRSSPAHPCSGRYVGYGELGFPFVAF